MLLLLLLLLVLLWLPVGLLGNPAPAPELAGPGGKAPKAAGETNNAKRRMAIVVFYNIVAIVVVAVVATVVAVGVFCHCVLSPVLAASYCHRLRFA